MVTGWGHEQTQQCMDIHTTKVQHVAAANFVKVKSRTFTAYGEELENKVFKYLGRLESSDNNNTQVIRGNLKKPRITWARLSRVLRADNASAPVCGCSIEQLFRQYCSTQVRYGTSLS